MGISCWIAHKAVWSPQNPAVRFRERQINYPEFESRIAHLAGYLSRKRGVSEGDRVAYLGRNHPAILDILFACARLGAIFVPLNARLTPSQLAVMLENADPTCLIAGPHFRSVVESCQVLRTQMELIHLQDPDDRLADALDLDALPKTESAIACNLNRDQNIPVLIAYTSGTTGTPKGAVFTQDALTFTAINSNNVWNMRGRDHVLTYLPMGSARSAVARTARSPPRRSRSACCATACRAAAITSTTEPCTTAASPPLIASATPR